MCDDLVKRLRGQYSMGPHTPNGDPEFGWRQFEAPPIQHEAAARIEELEAELAAVVEALRDMVNAWDLLTIAVPPLKNEPCLEKARTTLEELKGTK